MGVPPQPTGHYPLDLNRVFELTFSLFRFNWRTFLAMTLVIMVPVSLIMAVSAIYTSSAATDWITRAQQLAESGQIDMSTFPWAVFLVSLVIGVLGGIGAWLAQAAVTHAALKTYGGATIDTGSSVRYALGRLGTLAGAYMLMFLVAVAIIFIGVFAAALLILTSASGGRIVPGIGVFFGLIIVVASFAALIFISVRWALVVPAIVDGGAGARQALGRSWRLVSGSSWRVLGYMLAFGLLFGLIAALLTLVLTLVVDPGSLSDPTLTRPIDPVRVMIINFGAGLFSAMLMPFPAIGVTLLYLDLRWRRGEPVPQPGQAVPTPPAG